MKTCEITPTTAPPHVTIDQLRREVAELRHELAVLREDLAREVRTGRLVVAHPDGREMIHTIVDDETVTLYVGERTGTSPFCELSATRMLDTSDASVAVIAGGDVVAHLVGIGYANESDGRGYGAMHLRDAQYRAQMSSEVTTLDLSAAGGLVVESGQLAVRAQMVHEPKAVK